MIKLIIYLSDIRLTKISDWHPFSNGKYQIRGVLLRINNNTCQYKTLATHATRNLHN